MLQIIGKGGFAREVSGYTKEPTMLYENKEIEVMKENVDTIIAIGEPSVRKQLAFANYHLRFVLFFKGKQFGKNTYGVGTIVCPGTYITTGVTIGKHVIINLHCTIGHDCVIGDFTTISPGANISGNVTIGSECYIGTNAVIREKVSICGGVTIGAGTVVVKDITEPGIYVGNPSKTLHL
jgi:sugar O-acyltransferase (sialic acid O-acetyltransferase NeuD family)